MNRKRTILDDLTMSTIIPLARPNEDGFMSLERAMSSRRSHRDFSPEALSLEQIGQLTFAAQGQEPGGRYRTATQRRSPGQGHATDFDEVPAGDVVVLRFGLGSLAHDAAPYGPA